jgi:hypothetical protein
LDVGLFFLFIFRILFILILFVLIIITVLRLISLLSKPFLHILLQCGIALGQPTTPDMIERASALAGLRI